MDHGDELTAILDQWGGRPVAVRLVARGDELVAVFVGTLGRRSPAKGASLFWPVETGTPAATTLEETGIYVHPELISEVRLHTGGSVVEISQADTTVNVRQLAQ